MTNLFITFILYFFTFLILNVFVFRSSKYYNVILVLVFFIFNFNISTGYQQIVANQLIDQRLSSIFIALIICLVFTVNKNTFKLKAWSLYLLSLVIVYFTLEFVIRIADKVNYTELIITYSSIIILILIFKSLSNINIVKILYSINYIAILNGLLGIAQFITGKSLLIGNFNDSIVYQGETHIETIRTVGFSGTNNAAGNFGALLFGVVLYNCVKKRTPLSIVALLLTLLFSIFTFTRIGYVAGLIEIILAITLYRTRKRKTSYLKLAVTVLACFVLIIVGLTYSSDIIDKVFTERGNTQLARFVQYDLVYRDVIKNNWIMGIGTGQYQNFMYSNYGIYDIHIHSQYLNFFAENGILVLVLFIWFNIYVLIKILLANISAELKSLSFSLFIANLICSNFNPNQYYYINNILYYLLLLGIFFYTQKNSTSMITANKMYL